MLLLESLSSAGGLIALRIQKAALLRKIRLSEQSELRILRNAFSSFVNP